MFKERFDIMVKGKSTEDQVATYLVNVVLGLRDKENTQQAVRLLGCGSAIHHVILVAEIIRSRIKGVYSITEFESMTQKINNNNDQQESQQQFFNPAIRIILTMNPTQEEKLMPGFQEPNVVGDDKHIELFDYVMMYIRNLYFQRGNNKGSQRNNRNNNNQSQNNDRRNVRQNRDNNNTHKREDNNKRYQNQKSLEENSKNWNRDREEFQQTQNQRNYQYKGRSSDNINDPQTRSYDQRPDKSTSQTREEDNNQRGLRTRGQNIVKRGDVRTRGEIRTRGGQQKN